MAFPGISQSGNCRSGEEKQTALAKVAQFLGYEASRMAVIKAVGKKTIKDLALLKERGALRGFYLGGGTGLAFLLGHRESHDLDFFRTAAFRESLLVIRLRRAGRFSLERKEEGTVQGQFENTRVSFFHYPYPLLEKVRQISGAAVASPLDIACMKLDAISSRGTKRDFIDLYVVIQESGRTLQEFLGAFTKKYASLEYNLLHVKKSLVYFDDAERDPMPTMTAPIAWDAVKKFFIEEIKKL